MKKVLLLLGITAALGLASFTWPVGGVQAGGPPAFDDFNDALRIDKIPFTDFEYTGDATTEGNDPDLGSCVSATPEYGHSVWYQYTPAFNQTVDVDTIGSNFDTVLAAFTGTKGSLTQVACNDDISTGNFRSLIKVDLTGGTTYYFLAASFAGTSADSLQFNITPQDSLVFDDLTLKCYQARLAKRSARFQRQTLFTFDANFELAAQTAITGLSLYCNQAHQKEAPNEHGVSAGNGLSTDDFRATCFTARDEAIKGDPVAGRAVFAQNKFGDQKLTLRRLESICVLALKESGQLPNFSPFNGQILRCYTARPVKGAPRFQAASVFLFDQFEQSGKDARVLRPVSYCTLGGKASDRGCIVLDCKCGPKCTNGAHAGEEPQPNEVAVVCYSIRQQSFRPFNIPVIDQFLDQQFVDPLITIKKADRLCVPSVKKPPFADNDDFSNATFVDVEPPSGCAAAFDICRFTDHVVTMNATRARNDPPMVHCASVTDHVDYGHSVWYTFTPNNSAETHIDVDTEQSTYDTVLVLYSGSKGSLTQLACNDDDGNLQTSDLEFDLEVGHKYFIMVGSKDRTPGGKLKLNLDACDVTCDEE